MQKDSISRRQLLAAAFVALLSPVARRFPSSLVMAAGSSAWLAAPLALLPAALGVLFLCRLFGGGRGLGELFSLALGDRAGRAARWILSLWLIFYCGFILRSGAYRFTSTVYPSTAGGIFVVFTALGCLPMAAGSLAALARCAVLLRPLLLGVLLGVFAISLPETELRGLFSPEAAELPGALKSGLAVLSTLAPAAYLGFLVPKCRDELRPLPCMGWTLALLALTEGICLCCLGVFGAELTAKLNFPFFMLVRDIGLSDSFARMEALVVALWVFADAIHVSLLLSIAADNLGGGGRLPALAVTAAAALTGLLLPGDMLGVGLFSEKLIPAGNSLLVFVLIPLTAVLGRIRKRL